MDNVQQQSSDLYVIDLNTGPAWKRAMTRTQHCRQQQQRFNNRLNNNKETNLKTLSNPRKAPSARTKFSSNMEQFPNTQTFQAECCASFITTKLRGQYMTTWDIQLPCAWT
jgi:hypothetical protein